MPDVSLQITCLLIYHIINLYKPFKPAVCVVVGEAQHIQRVQSLRR